MSATTALEVPAGEVQTAAEEAPETPETDVNAEAAVGNPAEVQVDSVKPAGGDADAATGQKEAIETATETKGQAGSRSSGAATRVRESKLLPPALKERLARLMEASSEPQRPGEPATSIEEAVRAVEESLPDFLFGQRSRSTQPEHPDGDSFFSGDPRDLSDAEAERIAREQLARSGLLRGQRARVAE